MENNFLVSEIKKMQEEVASGKRTADNAWNMLCLYANNNICYSYSKEKMQRDFDEYFPDANKEVLGFIINFNWMHSKNGAEQELIRKQFRAGYCYYFATMLKAAFNRGEICWCAPLGHICWVDDDGTPYDVEGVCESEYDYLIPIKYLGDGIIDFLHIPGKEFDASPEYIKEIVENYKKDQNIC